LGCTELPLLFDREEFMHPVFNYSISYSRLDSNYLYFYAITVVGVFLFVYDKELSNLDKMNKIGVFFCCY